MVGVQAPGPIATRIVIPFAQIEDAQTLAQAIVNTLHEPFLVLDADLRVLSASPSFYDTFKVKPGQTLDRHVYDLGDGQWDIPALRVLLETIIPERTAMDAFEVVHDFPALGPRVMLLNARKVIYEASAATTILLAFTDITARRAIEFEKDQLHRRTEDLLRQQHVLMREMEHRVANSLQIIASMLMLKAKNVASDETRGHLRDAHQRVMSVATLQRHIHAAEGVETIELGVYLTALCESLVGSMVDEGQPIAVTVVVNGGSAPSAKALSLGLIVSELVINAIKYAFPTPRDDAAVRIAYEGDAEGWTLTVSDNGVGKASSPQPSSGGLGTVIIQALVAQLGATIDLRDTGEGLTVLVAGRSGQLTGATRTSIFNPQQHLFPASLGLAKGCGFRAINQERGGSSPRDFAAARQQAPSRAADPPEVVLFSRHFWRGTAIAPTVSTKTGRSIDDDWRNALGEQPRPVDGRRGGASAGVGPDL